MAVTIDGDGLIALGGTSSTQGRVRLAEDSDNGTNYIELTAPASVGSDRVITFPDATTTVVGTDTTQTLTNKTLGSGLVADASLITSGTSQASTSGTSIDFTGIPSWVKRITVLFDGVSLSGTDQFLVQIGDSGGLETTSYISGSAAARDGTATIGGTSTSGFIIYHGSAGTNFFYGTVRIENLTDNTWVASITGNGGSSGSPAANGISGGGSKTLSATLDRVTVTRTGTNTFDAGSINILFE